MSPDLPPRRQLVLGHRTPAVLGLVALIGLVTAASVPVSSAATAAGSTVSRAESLVPKPYSVEQRLDVDLDQDGTLDAVLVGGVGPVPLPESNEDATSDGLRVLVFARREGSGWRRVGMSTEALLCRRCGGAFWGVLPTPIELAASKGVVTVSQTVGSREVVDWKHRYRIERGRVRLIGRDRTLTDRATGGTVVTSTNYLTGVTIVKVDGTVEGAPRPGTKRGRPQTLRLEDVRDFPPLG
jgi:hypothetical protein